MKYAYFNDRPLSGQRTGVGHYLDLIRAHWPTDAQIELRGISEMYRAGARAESSAFEFPEIDELGTIELTPLSAMHRPRDGSSRQRIRAGLRRGYEFVTRRALQRAAKRDDFGMYFEPNHLPGAPLHPCVATIHDLSVVELPRFHPAHRVDWWRRRMERAIAMGDRFVCVSNATKDAMMRVLGCDEDRLIVIPLGSRWSAAPKAWSAEGVRARLRVPDRYWLHVGTIEPRKNIGRLLDAYATLSEAERAHTKLLLCGRVGWGADQFWTSLIEHPISSEVLCTGYASDAQVAALMLGSQGVLCPSHYEGFGLPTVEAMTLGVGAAISRAPSLLEVAGGTLDVIDAADSEGWAQAMLELGGGWDAARIERARQQAGVYSWSTAAQGHHDLFASLMDGA